jgi:hypothetical protein
VRRRLSFLFCLFVFPGSVLAAEPGTTHADPEASLVLWLAVILVAAKLGGDLATRVGQPAVLGELLFGVILGNASLVGVTALEPVKSHTGVERLAHFGVTPPSS